MISILMAKNVNRDFRKNHKVKILMLLRFVFQHLSCIAALPFAAIFIRIERVEIKFMAMLGRIILAMIQET